MLLDWPRSYQAPGVHSPIRETWWAVGTAAVGLVGSYIGQRSSNRQAANAAQNQGYVDTVTRRDPYSGTQGYREAGMQAAYETLFGRGEHPVDRPENGAQVQGDPNAVPRETQGGAGATRAAAPAGMRYNARGQLVRVRNPGPGGGGGGAQAAPFSGMSAETDEARRRLMALPDQEAGMYDVAEGYTTDTLQGEERNPLRGEATQAARDIAEDPRLSSFLDELEGKSPAAGTNGASNARIYNGPAPSTYYTTNAQGQVVPIAGGGGAVGAQGAGTTGTDAALRKLVAGENPAGWDDMEAGISRKVNEGRAANIRELRARAVGSGFYGSDLYKDLESGAVAKGDMEMADSLGAARFGAFQNALGLGTQYDLGMADVAARDRATSAGAGASAASLASQEQLAKMGLRLDALKLGETSRFGRAGALGDLAALTSNDQQAALRGINDLGTSRRGDLGAAADVSLSADANRNNYAAARGSERVGMAGVNLGRANLAFDRERFYDPFSRISSYTDVLGSLYGGYGTEETHGRDTRSSSPPAFSSPMGAALTGAALGGQLGSTFGANRKRAAGAAG